MEYFCREGYHCDECCLCWKNKGIENVKERTGVHFIKHSRVQQALLPICREHDSLKIYICITCQHICCRYCQNYHHSGHYTKTLDKYNEIKYTENIVQELEKVNNSKMEFGEAINSLEKEEQSLPGKQIDFFKKLTSNKICLLAKFLYMVRNIEKQIIANYYERKSFAESQIRTEKSRFSDQLNKLKNLAKRIEEFGSKSHLERYYDFNDLMKDLKKIDPYVHVLTENFKIDLNTQADNHQDNQFYKSISELLVISMKNKHFSESHPSSESYSYQQTMSVEIMLRNDDLRRTFINDNLKSLFDLNITGKYLTLVLVHVCLLFILVFTLFIYLCIYPYVNLICSFSWVRTPLSFFIQSDIAVFR